ncbi:MAG: carboxypeptidase-like regulatory domain-containing protein [Planctomycetota bacterium]|nr:carboxypeptidase-like regulatory domain-containing protein [Planctomycetota bacterium]
MLRSIPGFIRLTSQATLFTLPIFFCVCICQERAGIAQSTGSQRVASYSLEGTLVDEDARPIAGVELIAFLFSPSSSSSESDRRHLATTNEKGAWRWESLEHPKIYSIQARKTGYLNVEIPLAQQQSNLSILRKASSIQAYVVDDQDREVEGAIVSSIESGYDFADPPELTAKSDNRGWFELGGVQALAINLRAILPTGEAGSLNNLSLSSTSVPVIELKKPAPLELIVRDNLAKPISDALVRLGSWEKSGAIEWSARTDEQGKASWQNAPIGVLTFEVQKDGFQNTCVRENHKAQQSIKIVMFPNRISEYRVTDADTGEPIERFVVRYASDPALSRQSREEKPMDGDLQLTLPKQALLGANGKFTLQNIDFFDKLNIELIACGYQRQWVRINKSDAESSPIDFRLRRPSPEIMDSATILNPNGSVAANANVVFLAKGTMEIPSKTDPLIASLSWPEHAWQQTNSEGNFRLNAHPSHALHDFIVAWNDAGSFVGRLSEHSNGSQIQLNAYSTLTVRLPKESSRTPVSNFFIQHEYKGKRSYSVLAISTELERDESDESLVCKSVPSGKTAVLKRTWDARLSRFHSTELPSVEVSPGTWVTSDLGLPAKGNTQMR